MLGARVARQHERLVKVVGCPRRRRIEADHPDVCEGDVDPLSLPHPRAGPGTRGLLVAHDPPGEVEPFRVHPRLLVTADRLAADR